ncbi:hypothetical protein J3D55_000611 [Chryseobacterium ginsenosidimutans]|jgi:hypothetical protein|nr:hypothetical protein [Chryseobacterium ginsenosidimutans]
MTNFRAREITEAIERLYIFVEEPIQIARDNNK